MEFRCILMDYISLGLFQIIWGWKLAFVARNGMFEFEGGVVWRRRVQNEKSSNKAWNLIGYPREYHKVSFSRSLLCVSRCFCFGGCGGYNSQNALLTHSHRREQGNETLWYFGGYTSRFHPSLNTYSLNLKTPHFVPSSRQRVPPSNIPFLRINDLKQSRTTTTIH